MTLTTLRPSIVLALASSVLLVLLVAVVEPLYLSLDDALQEWSLRQQQRRQMEILAASKPFLESAVAASAGADDDALLFHGRSLTEVESAAQSAVRTMVQNEGVTLKSIDVRVFPAAGNRTRLHLTVSAVGENQTLIAVIRDIEQSRPKLNIVSLRLRADNVLPGGAPQPLSLDLNLDGFADVL